MAPHVFVEQVTLAGVQAARAAWDSGKLHAALAKLHADPRAAFFGWNDAWRAPGFRDWNIESELLGIRGPVLAIQGYGDRYATMEQLDRIARGVRGPCELLKLADCGHSPHRDQPARVIEAIARLCRTIDAASTP
jgi:pimeloyl-ACP methyl ester carboxylesterase